MCTTSGHGELHIEATGNALARWERSAQRLVDAGVSIVEVAGPQLEFSGCSAVVVMGPTVAFGAEEVLALDAYHKGGGALVVALRSIPVSVSSLSAPSSGLEVFLETSGVQVLAAAVVDPDAQLDTPGAWMTYEGYGEHPIVRDFARRRATIWYAPLALGSRNSEVHHLVSASAGGYAETDLRRLHALGESENSSGDGSTRTVAVAVHPPQRGRLAVFGSAEVFSNQWSERGIGGNERLLLETVQWLLARDNASTSPALRPERIRLLMTRANLRNAFIWCVLAGPLALALLGALLWWWRRREPGYAAQ